MDKVIVLLAPLLTAPPGATAEEKITLDRKGQVAVYAGDWRLKWTRAEFLLDIDPNPPGTAGPMKARTRLVLSPFTAKRLQVALKITLERHEAAFGTVDLPPAKGPRDEPTLDPGLVVVYANFCRVTATPEEMFLDFGLSENPFAPGPKTITLTRTVILPPLGGKRLLAELTRAVAGYEAEHGVIELDVRKRAKQKLKL
jgi:hypothetical protein